MPAEKQKRSLILILLALFVVSAIAILWAVKSRLHEHAVLEAESQIQNLLYTYSSVRQLIRQYHKPEVYRLISEGILSKDYFTPQLLSSTFNATSFIDILNKKLQQEHKPAVAFKLATDNPINPKNLADEKEQRLLKKMRNGEISHYKQIISSPTGEQILFYALPTDPVQPQCLLCHGNPQDAPAQMIQQYGNQSGFNETAGNIRALVSMHLPLKTYADSTRKCNGWVDS